MARKKAEEKLNLDTILFKCRDILRQARNSGSFFEKRDMMLTLVFLRFIGEKFEDGTEHLRQTLIEEGLDPDDEEIWNAFFNDPTFTDGTYNLPVAARWSTIINTPAPQLNVALDTALKALGDSDKQLKGCFVEGTFTTRNLESKDIKMLVDEINKISHKKFGEEKDLIGRVYEYFLKEFAVNATKEEGEYYTPHDVVQLIAAMIEPFDGTLYDPCCGSGGMFIQSAELVAGKGMNIQYAFLAAGLGGRIQRAGLAAGLCTRIRGAGFAAEKGIDIRRAEPILRTGRSMDIVANYPKCFVVVPSISCVCAFL